MWARSEFGLVVFMPGWHTAAVLPRAQSVSVCSPKLPPHGSIAQLWLSPAGAVYVVTKRGKLVWFEATADCSAWEVQLPPALVSCPLVRPHDASGYVDVLESGGQLRARYDMATGATMPFEPHQESVPAYPDWAVSEDGTRLAFREDLETLNVRVIPWKTLEVKTKRKRGKSDPGAPAEGAGAGAGAGASGLARVSSVRRPARAYGTYKLQHPGKLAWLRDGDLVYVQESTGTYAHNLSDEACTWQMDVGIYNLARSTQINSMSGGVGWLSAGRTSCWCPAGAATILIHGANMASAHSPDGRFVYMLDSWWHVSKHDAITGKRLWLVCTRPETPYTSHKGFVETITVSADGTQLAAVLYTPKTAWSYCTVLDALSGEVFTVIPQVAWVATATFVKGSTVPRMWTQQELRALAGIQADSKDGGDTPKIEVCTRMCTSDSGASDWRMCVLNCNDMSRVVEIGPNGKLREAACGSSESSLRPHAKKWLRYVTPDTIEILDGYGCTSVSLQAAGP